MWRLFLAFILVLPGCQTLSVQEEGESHEPVRIVEEEESVANCTKMDEVRVAAPFRFLTKAIPESSSLGDAEIEKTLRYQTRLVRGDTVLRRGVENGMTLGTAYDCE
jgi:hypothetical protein